MLKQPLAAALEGTGARMSSAEITVLHLGPCIGFFLGLGGDDSKIRIDSEHDVWNLEYMLQQHHPR